MLAGFHLNSVAKEMNARCLSIFLLLPFLGSHGPHGPSGGDGASGNNGNSAQNGSLLWTVLGLQGNIHDVLN